jgi:hypothetical protein
MTADDELGRIWKKMVITYFKVLSQCLPRGIKENHEKILA